MSKLLFMLSYLDSDISLIRKETKINYDTRPLRPLTEWLKRVKTRTSYKTGGRDMELLKASEVCRLCNVSRRSLYRWVKHGMIIVFRTPGGHWRFDIREIRRMLLDNIFEPRKNQRVAG